MISRKTSNLTKGFASLGKAFRIHGRSYPPSVTLRQLPATLPGYPIKPIFAQLFIFEHHHSGL